jgi:hypothetical protein
MSQQLYTQLVPAGQAAMVSAPGAVLTVKTVGGSATVALDGKGPTPVSGGTVLNGPFSTVNIFNGSAADWTITFFVGDAAVLFAPGDNSTNNAKSYLWGNLGIKTNTAANSYPNAPACDANGFLQITSNMYLLVSGTRNGARRQVLTLSVSPTAPVYLNVLDPNSGADGEYAAITLAAGSQIELLTDSDVILSASGVGQVVGVTVGQIFLSNQ